MGSLPTPECPHCGVPHDRWDSTASHMAQKGDSEHTEETHSDGVETLESEYQIRKKASGWEPADPVGEGGPPTSDESTESAAEASAGDRRGDPDNPLLRTPPAKSDGRPVCDSCGSAMERTGAGQRYEVKTDDGAAVAETHRDDHICGNCKVLETNDGQQYDIIA